MNLAEAIGRRVAEHVERVILGLPTETWDSGAIGQHAMICIGIDTAAGEDVTVRWDALDLPPDEPTVVEEQR